MFFIPNANPRYDSKMHLVKKWLVEFIEEDASRKRKDNSTHNYGVICKIALNMIKQQDGKDSFKKRRFKALLNSTEREKLMGLF